MNMDTHEIAEDIKKRVDDLVEERIRRREAEATAEERIRRREAEATAEERIRRREAEAAAEERIRRREAEAAAEERIRRREAEAAAEERNRRREAQAIAAERRVHALFQPYSRPQQTYRARPSEKVKKKSATPSSTFVLPRVYLIASKERTRPIRTNDEISLMFTNKLVAEFVEINTIDTMEDVVTKLKQRFKKVMTPETFMKLLNTPVQLLKDEGGALYPPMIPEGRSLDGLLVKEIFKTRKKFVYMRTIRDINALIPCPSEQSDEDEPKMSGDSNRHNADTLHTQESNSTQDVPMEDYNVFSDPGYFLNDTMADNCEENNTEIPHSSSSISESNVEKPSPVEHKTEIPCNPVYTPDDETVKMLLAAARSGPRGTTLFINRQSPLESTLIGLSQNEFTVGNKIWVTFTDNVDDDEDWGDEEKVYKEESMDAGGPRLEFFSLVLKDMHQSSIFEGPEGKRSLAYDSAAESKGLYLRIGQIIAYSLSYSGPGPSFFSDDMCTAIRTGTFRNRELSSEHVYDPDLRTELLALEATTTLAAFNEKLADCQLLTTTAGIAVPSAKDNIEKKELMRLILHELLVKRLESPLRQFLQGINCLSGVDILAQRQDLFMKFFKPDTSPLTASYVRKLFKRIASPKGTERKIAEDRVDSHWKYYLNTVKDNKEGVTLEKIVFFATGCEREPPFGWHTPPSIQYLHESKDPDTLPTAQGCACILFLPVHYGSYENFCLRLDYAFANCNTLSLE